MKFNLLWVFCCLLFLVFVFSGLLLAYDVEFVDDLPCYDDRGNVIVGLVCEGEVMNDNPLLGIVFVFGLLGCIIFGAAGIFYSWEVEL